MQLIDNQDRKKYAEGRNYGFSSAFCIQKEKDVFETLMPITACKDFLNDFIYTELTNKSISVHGSFFNKPTGILQNDYVTLACKILDYHNGNLYTKKKQEEELLMNNVHNFERIMHEIETLLGVTNLTKFDVLNEEKTLLIHSSNKWFRTTFYTSLHGFLIRNAFMATDTDTISDFVKKEYVGDYYNFEKIKAKMNKLFNDNNLFNLTQNFDNFKSPNIIHNYGIIACNEI